MTEKYYSSNSSPESIPVENKLKSRVLLLKHLATEIWPWKTSVAKLILVVSRLSDLKFKMEELNFAVKGLQNKVTCLEEKRALIKTKTSDGKFTSIEKTVNS